MATLLYDPYLEPDALANVKFYKYSAVDKSIIYNHVLKRCELSKSELVY